MNAMAVTYGCFFLSSCGSFHLPSHFSLSLSLFQSFSLHCRSTSPFFEREFTDIITIYNKKERRKTTSSNSENLSAEAPWNCFKLAIDRQRGPDGLSLEIGVAFSLRADEWETPLKTHTHPYCPFRLRPIRRVPRWRPLEFSDNKKCYRRAGRNKFYADELDGNEKRPIFTLGPRSPWETAPKAAASKKGRNRASTD